jgi:osmoprotectant transport system permease protein
VTRALLDEILSLSLEHVWLVLISISVAVVVALPGGIWLTRRERWRRWVLGFVNIVQTIPSLAVFGFLLPVPLVGGIGKRTAIIALVLYALLPILKNTLVGILGVDPAVRETAVAMGMTDRQLLFQVEMPLAAPAILAGIRIATVTAIGTATIAAAIGGGGLGVFIFRGIAMVDTAQVLAGAVPAALMALAADEALGWIERKLSPA